MEIISKNELELSFKKDLFRSKVILILELIFIVICIGIFFFTEIQPLKTSMLICASISVGLWLFISLRQILLLRIHSVRLDKIIENNIGNFSKTEVTEMISSALSEFTNKETPAIYVMKTGKAMNALTIDTYFFNFLKPFNALYISKPLFEKLSAEEFKAMLFHELGHFHHFMYADMRLKFPFFLCALLPFAFIVLMPGSFKIFGVFAALTIVIFYIIKKTKRNNHEIEYLSDLFAASKVGKMNMMNLLIILGNEYKAVKKDTVAKKISEKISIPQKRILINWKEFDTQLANSKIEREEYDNFIQAILKEKDAQIIDSDIDIDHLTHPSLTKRILFMHTNCI